MNSQLFVNNNLIVKIFIGFSYKGRKGIIETYKHLKVTCPSLNNKVKKFFRNNMVITYCNCNLTFIDKSRIFRGNK